MMVSKRNPNHSEMFSFLKMPKKEFKHLLKNVNPYLQENNRKVEEVCKDEHFCFSKTDI